MITLEKKFRFESAHRLAKGYVGKCANIHGHSWNGKLIIRTEGLDEFGMGFDYKEMGKFTKGIEKQLDHKLLLFKGDKELVRFCTEHDQNDHSH